MKYQFISDSHIHSCHSFDGKDSVAMLAERAASLGLYAITVTDHFECNDLMQHDYLQDISSSVTDVIKVRALYHDRVKLFKGIELGQPTQNMEAADQALALSDFDFVLGSLHNLCGEKDFYFLTYTQDNYHSLLERYFQEVLELALTDCFDSLAHLTYPFRYIAANPEIRFDKKVFSDRIKQILEVLVRNRKALEVNTSGLRQVIGETLPDEEILKMFYELGGRYVTLGSDAHRWGDVGAGIEDGLHMLEKCGFTHVTIYEKREPQLLPIR